VTVKIVPPGGALAGGRKEAPNRGGIPNGKNARTNLGSNANGSEGGGHVNRVLRSKKCFVFTNVGFTS